MAKAKQPAKSKAQAVREAIEQLQADDRDVTTAAILALLPVLGVKNAKATDVYQSDPWKELREKEKAGKGAAAPAEPVDAAVPASEGVSKGDAVRQALATLGKDAKVKAVLEHVKEQHGLDVSYQTVLNIKGAGGKPGKKRGRPRKVEAVVAIAAALAARKPSAGDISLDDIRAVKDLAERLGADKVRQLAEVLA